MKQPRVLERTSDYFPPVTFGVFAVTGSLFIIAAKFVGLNALLVTGIPVILMASYAIAIFLFRRLRLRDDQTGDNFYYMGFIFTLTSLAVSLIQFSSGGTVDEIVQNFGIAIASTIAGIVFRILFNMVRRDPVEVEHIARLDLSDASRKVRRELDNVLLEMAHFRRTNQQMLQEGFAETQQQLEASAKAATTFIDDTARLAQERIEASSQVDSTEKIRKELEQTTVLLVGINASLREVAATTAAVAEELRLKSQQSFWRRAVDGLWPRSKPQGAPREPRLPNSSVNIIAAAQQDVER